MGVRLSEKHGLNPAIPKCFFCGEGKNEIILFGRRPGDAEAPHGKVIDKEPCDKCKEYMSKGVMFISVRNGENGDNPYRTGNLVVITDSAVRRIIQPAEVMEGILKSRMAFVDDETWDKLGLPRSKKN